MYNLQASKNLSQNFLMDLNVTDRIVKHCFPPLPSGVEEPVEPRTTVIEVGPGPGPLTRSLLNSPHVKQVISVEKDDRFFPALQLLAQATNDQFKLVQGDILEVDEEELLLHYGLDQQATDFESWQTMGSTERPEVLLTGNLPFGIATPLLIKWLRDLNQMRGAFRYGRVPMILMFQKEVGDRMVAKPRTKEYGRLSVVTQSLCRVEECFVVRGKTFVPPPKVDASVMRLDPLPIPVEPDLQISDLEKFCNVIFNSRRKQLYSNLRSHLTDADCKRLVSMVTKREALQRQEEELNARLLEQRPDQLSVEVICHLAKLFAAIKQQ